MTFSMPSEYSASQSPILHNYSSKHKPPIPNRPFSDPNLLAPEAAFYTHQPHKRQQQPSQSYHDLPDSVLLGRSSLRGGGPKRSRPRRKKNAHQTGQRPWQKLLWVKQRDYPDNYTDPPTFLSHLQVNPRLRPYEFWPLVAHSTVIVQHISSVAIFICSFVGIYEERVSPLSVLSVGSAMTSVGWILWDFWMGQAASSDLIADKKLVSGKDGGEMSDASGLASSSSTVAHTPTSHTTDSGNVGLGLTLSASNSLPSKGYSHSRSQTSVSSAGLSPVQPSHHSQTLLSTTHPASSSYSVSRNAQRFSTIKSAVLIYIALLGLSPILKSLTKSTTSDSIWAMSCWLMGTNIFFFDYSGGVAGVQFPASLSTNAALMASTVLASRLRNTTHVFSLTIFSIQIFGLFPVFRRHLRHVSWRAHLALTFALVLGAGAELGLAISGRSFLGGGWKRAIAGSIIWSLGCAVGMGGCSWWLIGLQRYKNVVIGPWDPARPVIRENGWS